SLSVNDYVGHVFGPRSWESLDNLLRLDAALARFMDGLDRRFGPGGWALLLTADHGVLDRAGTLLMPKAMAASLEAAADAELGPRLAVALRPQRAAARPRPGGRPRGARRARAGLVSQVRGAGGAALGALARPAPQQIAAAELKRRGYPLSARRRDEGVLRVD